MKKNKKIKCIIITLLLLLLLIYVSAITNLPENIILFEGEKLNLKTIWGIDVETIASSNPNIEKIQNAEVVPLRKPSRSKTIHKRSASRRNVRNNWK